MNSLNVGSIQNHRERETGSIIYPVISRRSRGLSVGINLYPDSKLCSFNCAYCEVFPFKTENTFTLKTMQQELRTVLRRAAREGIPIKDLCISGNGEPTLSPSLPVALMAAQRAIDAYALDAQVVLITNGTGLLFQGTFNLLANAANEGLAIWIKLDAGSPEWYERINRSHIPFDIRIDAIRRFLSVAPATIQTMLCKIEGAPPPPEEANAWVRLVADLAAANKTKKTKTGMQMVQLYGKARPAQEDPLAEQLPDAYLTERAKALQTALAGKGLSRKAVPIEVFP